MKGGFPKHLSGWHRPIQKSVFEHAEAHIAVDNILKKPMELVKNLSLKIMSEVIMWNHSTQLPTRMGRT